MNSGSLISTPDDADAIQQLSLSPSPPVAMNVGNLLPLYPQLRQTPRKAVFPCIFIG